MTEQPPFGNEPPPRWGGYPPPPPYGSYPTPSYGSYPPPAGGYSPGGYPPQAPGGLVTFPGMGTVAVATIWQRLLARLIDSLIYGVFYAIFLVIGAAVVSSTAVTDFHGHTTSEHSGLEMPGFLLALAATLGSVLVYEWLMLAYKGATLGKMAVGIKVVNQVTGQILSFGSAFVRPLVPLAASVFCVLLALLVYLSPLFDGSGRLRGWHDKAADDVVIKVR
jgi:uncharacterized RDD family membrane protein YckC